MKQQLASKVFYRERASKERWHKSLASKQVAGKCLLSKNYEFNVLYPPTITQSRVFPYVIFECIST